MRDIAFPYITPSSRVYTAGKYPTKIVDFQNGAQSAIRYGNRRSQSKLQLKFENVEERWAREILTCYKRVNENWNYVRFNKGDDMNLPDRDRGGAWEGVEDDRLVSEWYQENFEDASKTYWRFAEPPTITSVTRGIVNISCSFVSYLDAD